MKNKERRRAEVERTDVLDASSTGATQFFAASVEFKNRFRRLLPSGRPVPQH